MSMGVAVTCYGMPDGWKGQLLKSWLMVVAHSSPEVARPLSFKTSQFNESRQLICNFLLHFSAGRRVNERRGSRLRFVLSEALAAVMAVSYPSPGTAVAPGCRQFRGWIVCVVTVCHLGLCWQAGLAYIARHSCLSLGPCFTLWKSLPQLREVLSLNADRALWRCLVLF